VSALHWKDGIHFERLEDGSVRVFVRRWARSIQDGAVADDEALMTIPPDEWASIVAFVSADGHDRSLGAVLRMHKAALRAHMDPEAPLDREAAKDVYAEGVAVGLELGRRMGKP